MNRSVLSDQNKIPGFLSGSGEMVELIRNFNWSATSLGPISRWPQSLLTSISLCLHSAFPMAILWGPELLMLYNDAYRHMTGGKHPQSLGARGKDVWPEVWHIIGPMLEGVIHESKATWSEDRLLLLNRYGFAEESYFTFSYSPIHMEGGGVGGVLCAVNETTEAVISNRHLRTLRDLGHHCTELKRVQDVYDFALQTLQKNPHDFPFALLYNITDNGDEATLMDTAGIDADHPAAPAHIPLSDMHPWATAIRSCIAGCQPVVVSNLQQYFSELPTGAWRLPPAQAYVIPMILHCKKSPYAVLIAGINPHAQLTEKYRSFFHLVVDQMATEIASVYAYLDERSRAEALTELDRAKSAFFSNISHEFRTPLTLMLGPLEELLNDQQLREESKAGIELAYRNALRLLKLVNSLLDFSRIEAGRLRAQFKRINLAAATRDLASSFRSAIHKAGMQLIVNCPEIPGPAYVDVDMWEKIVLNLLSNAFKYTLSGAITVALRQENGRIELSVSDTGIGIPEEEQPKVFERFYRIQHSAARSQEGTGIGLALVNELVRMHKGTVQLKSRPGQGTRVTVTIPAGKEHLPADLIGESAVSQGAVASLTDLYLEEALSWLPTEPARTITNADTANLPPLSMQNAEDKRLRILVADDNSDMRTYLTRLLESRYQVTATSNGTQAFEIAKKILPDLVLSDVTMPGMDGFSLVNALRNDTSTLHTPIILLSARAGEDATVKGLQSGVDDYMVKPFSANELLARIDANIKVARSRIYASRQMQNLFMNTPFPIATLSGPELRYSMVNDAFKSISHNKDVLGKTIAEVFPGTGEDFLQSIRNVYTTGKPFIGIEFKSMIADEQGITQERYFDFAFSPMYELNGDIIGVIGVGTDCTEKVKARERLMENEERLQQEVEQRTLDLKKTNEALARSNRDLEQYAFVTSHDLQEPLRKIQTFANQIYRLHKDHFNEKSHVYFNKMMGASKRMSTLINDLLYFSRLAHEEKFVLTNLNHILEDVVNDFELLIEQKDATIRSEPLPVIEAIPFQMNQLFSNLLSNALKFTNPERKPQIYIASSIATSEELSVAGLLPSNKTWYKILFRDNGIGFHPRYSEKIFEVFQHLHDRGSYEGTGMGLAMCSRIMSNHNGVIYAYGEEGKGAEFHLLIPDKH